MSWFKYGEVTKRENRKGLWLRISSESVNDVLKEIKKTGFKRFSEVINRVVVCELRPNNQVLLEVWCKSPIDMLLRKKFRSNVFYIQMTENLNWTCEGDLGKGFTV
jgi:hypothetical protein